MVRYRSSAVCHLIVQLREQGYRQREVADMVGMTQGAISKVLKRHRETGTPVPRKRPGPGFITTARDDRYLVRLCRIRRWDSSRQLRLQWRRLIRRPVSCRTVRRRLVRAGYRARRPARCPALTEDHRRRRRVWAHQHRNWTVDHWRHAVFADESRFTLHGSDGRLLVRRSQGERLLGTCVAPNHGSRQPSVMVWGAVHHGGKSDLVIFDENVNQGNYVDVMRDSMLSFARASFQDNFVFVHDNAPPHTARRTRDFLAEEEVEVMQWPPKSPDMNTIEHVWDQMGVILRDMDNPPSNLAELRQALVHAWNQIPVWRVTRLVSSMPRRVRALRAAHGGYTRY